VTPPAARVDTAEAPAVARTPEQLADAFFAVAHALKRTVNGRFQHTALSVARLRVLFTLATMGPQRMGELSTCVDVAARTMTSTVEAMARDGLVRREPDPVDGRATVVHLTDDGRRAYDEGRRVQAATVADVFEGLDGHQRAELAELLEALAARIPGDDHLVPPPAPDAPPGTPGT
jgi:DNA-binding MarR family transcriptional regulator